MQLFALPDARQIDVVFLHSDSVCDSANDSDQGRGLDRRDGGTQ
jgi:hypothetical protein